MTVVEQVLCWSMIGLAAGSMLLCFARGARMAPLAITGEAVMLAAMVDVCLVGSRLVSPVMWCAALLALAIAAAASARLRRSAVGRGASGGASHDGGHPLGMILGAGLLATMGAAGATGSAQATGHAHGLSPTAIIGVLAVLTLGYGVGVIVALRRRRMARVEVARRLASLSALLAMAAMPLAAMVA